MLRKFTVSVGRFSAGEVRDYPTSTWTGIARTLRQELSAFTSEADEPFVKKRGRPPKSGLITGTLVEREGLITGIELE